MGGTNGDGDSRALRLGWVGTGRMGYALASRLLDAGHDVAVYNRTRAKAEPLAQLGATIVDTPAELADRDIVFTMVAGSDDFRAVVTGPEGLLSNPGQQPRIIVDSTTIAPAAAEEVRAVASERGTAILAAPVSGNPKVVSSGRLTVVVSGPADAWGEARPLLELFGKGVTYVGEGELARTAKICHNLMLGVVSQCLAEITVLAEKAGIEREDLLEFINGSVMGSMFTRYKTPAFVNLDYSPTFTPILLQKDFDLGFELAHDLEVPMPVAATTAQAVQALIGSGHTTEDFAMLLDQQARLSGLELEPREVEVSDGLEPLETESAQA
ncbi:NAD(P)-dependent oxidoreductase [Thermoleophilia bacterium SCSIO 60948]|nr:NAD(P)-dependent oxidoreductase [Thermoleophilia bacterium SCSIO 60948]